MTIHYQFVVNNFSFELLLKMCIWWRNVLTSCEMFSFKLLNIVIYTHVLYLLAMEAISMSCVAYNNVFLIYNNVASQTLGSIQCWALECYAINPKMVLHIFISQE